MIFPEKHTIYVVVSIPGLISVDSISKLVPEIVGYYTHEYSADEEAKRLSTWRTVGVLKQEVDINDLVRMLNVMIKEPVNER